LRVDADVDTSHVEAGLRSEVLNLGGEFYQIVLRFGFAEDIDVPERLKALDIDPGLDPDKLTYFIGRDKVVAEDKDQMPRWRKALFAYMTRNAMSATTYYGMPARQLIEIGTKIGL